MITPKFTKDSHSLLCIFDDLQVGDWFYCDQLGNEKLFLKIEDMTYDDDDNTLPNALEAYKNIPTTRTVPNFWPVWKYLSV